MNHDWLFQTDESICQLRTAGVLVRDGKVLVQRDGVEYALPGGHVQIGETTEEGIVREYKEETGADIKVGRLLWTEECIWTWNGKLVHDLAFYYQIELCDRASLPDTGEFVPQKDNSRIVLGWLPREQLANLEIYPDFIKEQIFHLDAPLRHFITRVSSMRKKFDIIKLSAHFTVRNLNQEDAEIIYDLCRRNTLFYQYHPPFVTVESIREDMEALPPGKSYQDKHYIGFLRDAELVAVMDLIEDYPHMGNAWIGFFAMNTLYQGKGIGTSIISDCASYLGQIGFDQVRLGVDKGNPQSKAFWTKNHFALTGEEFPSDAPSYLMMERKL